MRAPAFWQREKPNLAARLLAPLGAVYGALTARRMTKGGAIAGAPVICVGNFVAGGAGKTPTAIAIAKLLIARRERPFFLTRGYGGRVSSNQPVLVDPQRHRAHEVGDEPLLLAAVAPTIVCHDRVAGAQAAEAAGATVLVMDDGLQNPSLRKDVAIAVVDGGAGIGNGLSIPAGPLRAPLTAQWPHVTAALVIGPGAAGERVAAMAGTAHKRIFTGELRCVGNAGSGLTDKPLYAFAGIGRPEKFFETLRELGANLVGTRSFPDHHAFTPGELDDLGHEAARLGATLVTTEKDRVRLPPDFAADALPVSLVVKEPDFAEWLTGELTRVRASRSLRDE